ncbi:MAG TPA: 3'-5' exonuclease [Spirochaetota bacterium]|nr:3'-5' exonuclease [Spirochaetota bacterium]HOS54727.1 3'-5' exonuclease [Spirochaetota bacterium]HPK61472.1 3'-5' exonuclease [Spirochaetota bacterium]HQF76595.1 3'-5' exonuclease [Spirochaetota bacterium]HQH30704.1 3'-5' exonuclease [Spirochaetota bacterium]
MSIFSLFSQSLIKEDYVFFDLETTGLFPLDGDRVVELAMIKTKKGEVVDKLEFLFNPGMPIPVETSSINKITNDMVKDSPLFSREIGERIIEFIDKSILVAHNAPFDLSFLSSEMARVGVTYEGWSAIDTLKMSKELLRLPKYKLDNIVKYYDLSSDGEYHRALYDTECLMKIYFSLVDEESLDGKNLEYLIRKYGYTGNAIYRFIRANIREAMIDKSEIFGKYKKRDGSFIDLRVVPLAPVWVKNYWYFLGEEAGSKKILSLKSDSFVEFY